MFEHILTAFEANAVIVHLNGLDEGMQGRLGRVSVEASGCRQTGNWLDQVIPNALISLKMLNDMVRLACTPIHK